MQASMVPIEHVSNVWPHVEEYLARAAKYTYGRYEVQDILASITDYEHTLWIAFDDTGIKGTVVTSFIHYPRKKYVAAPFVAGVNFSAWKYPMLKLLQHWAHDNQCDGIESCARLGWARMFKEDGYEPLWQTFQLPAADAGLGA